jgi:predicted short-subunit dehydrogenase-like oxidoreductase (DUF2520 family)
MDQHGISSADNYPLRSKVATTMGKLTFVVRENLCRAFHIGRTVKKYFVVGFLWGARQTLEFAVRFL